MDRYATGPAEVMPRLAGAAVGFLLAFLLAGAVAHCQPPDARAMTVEGAEGVWLPLPQARDALEAVRTRPGYQERVRLLTEALSLAGQEADALRQAIRLGERQVATWAGVVTAASDARERAEAELAAKWPGWAWAAIGAVLGAGLVVVALIAV